MPPEPSRSAGVPCRRHRRHRQPDRDRPDELSGYLSIGPAATNNPGSSTLNFPVGDDRANAVTVALGTGGTLSITFVAPSNGPTAHAIFDVTGYFTPDMSGATYVPLTPTRVLDTRNGTGGLAGPFTNHAARTFTVGGVPASAIAVTGNLTVTGQTVQRLSAPSARSPRTTRAARPSTSR